MLAWLPNSCGLSLDNTPHLNNISHHRAWQEELEGSKKGIISRWETVAVWESIPRTGSPPTAHRAAQCSENPALGVGDLRLELSWCSSCQDAPFRPWDRSGPQPTRVYEACVQFILEFRVTVYTFYELKCFPWHQETSTLACILFLCHHLPSPGHMEKFALF